MIDVQCSCRTVKQPNPAVYCAYTNVFVPALIDSGVYLTPFSGVGANKNAIWYDGDNVYYSHNSHGIKHYKWNLSKRVWEEVVWNNLSDFSGYDIWSDGINIYHSYDGSHHKLIKETNSWEPVTFDGMDIGHGQYIWTDGTNIYYSYNDTHRKLNVETSTWESVDWTKKFYGNDVWTDGVGIYSGAARFDKDTGKWYSASISGSATDIWSDGTNVYKSHFNNPGTSHNKLNRDTLKWEAVTFGEDGYFSGASVWTDGKNIYHNGDILLPTTTSIYSKDDTGASGKSGWYKVASVGNGILFSINDKKYYAENGMTWDEWCTSDYNTSTYFVYGNFVSDDPTTPEDYVTSDGTASVLPSDMIMANHSYTVMEREHSGGSGN